jgi:hypothetical protein
MLTIIQALTLENQIYPGNLVPEPTPEVAWGEIVDKDLLKTLPEAEIRRQTIISKVILKEQQYVQDLDLIETVRKLTGAFTFIDVSHPRSS